MAVPDAGITGPAVLGTGALLASLAAAARSLWDAYVEGRSRLAQLDLQRRAADLQVEEMSILRHEAITHQRVVRSLVGYAELMVVWAEEALGRHPDLPEPPSPPEVPDSLLADLGPDQATEIGSP